MKIQGDLVKIAQTTVPSATRCQSDIEPAGGTERYGEESEKGNRSDGMNAQGEINKAIYVNRAELISLTTNMLKYPSEDSSPKPKEKLQRSPFLFSL